MEYKNISLEIEDGVARLTLNRPPLNILNIEMMNEMNAVFEELKGETLKSLVIQAEGKAFCAGVDVGEHTAEKVHEMITTFHRMFRLLNAVPGISIGVVNGAALGGGCELSMFCDLVIASESSKFGQPEIKVGVIAPVAAVILPHLIGRNRALEMLATGDTIDGKEAERIGLINHCFPTEGFTDRAEEFIGRIANMSARIIRFTRDAVDKSFYSTVEGGIQTVEEIYLEALMKSEDAHEGLKAFMERRPPKWTDK
jgi:cyclohexa-1,5-dienecarbonyl-CoA hydratase